MAKEIDFQKEIERVNAHNHYMAHSGIKITELSFEHAVAEVELIEERTNLFGMAHGGLVCTMMDCAAGILARSDGRKYVTSSMELKFIGNVTGGKIYAKSSVISRGRKLCNLLVQVTSEEGKLLSEGMATFYCISE